MDERSLLSLPLGQWNYAAVDEFLKRGHRESEVLEYKREFSDRILDSIVAMANGSGGHIFVGVDEDDRTRAPRSWPHLPAREKFNSRFHDLVVAYTDPLVPLTATTVWEENETSPNFGKQIVIARVEPGQYPPYFARNRGIKIRTGDSDVLANIGEIMRLIERRNQSEDIATEHQEHLNRLLPGKGKNAIFGMYIAPLSRAVRIPRTETAERAIRDAVWGYLFIDEPVAPERNSEGVRFNRTPTEWVYVSPTGLIHFQRDYGGRYVDGHLQVDDLMFDAYETLRLASWLLPNVGGYRGPWFVGSYLVGLHDARLFFHYQPTGSSVRRATSGERASSRWTFGEILLDPIDIADITRRLISDLGYEAGYSNYDLPLQTAIENLPRRLALITHDPRP